jgi:ATP-binding cassette subfamily G (WHITE) protein 2 (PDR)
VFSLGSVYYNLANDTDSFYLRGSLIFFAILMNTFSSALEVNNYLNLYSLRLTLRYIQILTLYAQRPIVEKHRKFALYHPVAEALSSMICGLPLKVLVAISFNLTLYFMSDLRRDPGAFFTFVLFSFFATLTMSSIFRTIAAVSRTLAEAMAPSAMFILMLIIYTGFAIPTSNMKPWFRWMNYLNPVAYAFESLMINEFHNRDFPCSVFIPSGSGYENAIGLERTCSTTGSVAGSSFVNGDDYINQSFKYYAQHKWRCERCIGYFSIFSSPIYRHR